MKKLLILLLLIIQVGISTVLAQEPQQTETNQEFEVFPEQIEIVNIELGDSILLKKIESTFNLASKTVKKLEVRQAKNNSIIEDGNKQITELNEKALLLHKLVEGYYVEHDGSKRSDLLHLLNLNNSTNDTILAVHINSHIEEIKLRGKIVNEIQDKSIAQNVKDKELCNTLITQWYKVMQGMMLYFSSKTATPTERKNAKQKIEAALTELNTLCNNN